MWQVRVSAQTRSLPVLRLERIVRAECANSRPRDSKLPTIAGLESMAAHVLKRDGLVGSHVFAACDAPSQAPNRRYRAIRRQGRNGRLRSHRAPQL
jgi:hypothetical protein